MSKDQIYNIYSHSDADGGIAAAIFSKFISEKYSRYNWNIDVTPVNHVSANGDWFLRDIKWPCAILDFSLHPFLLSNKFFQNSSFFKETTTEKKSKEPPCYWIDHHPTGSSFPFLTEQNVAEYLPFIKTKWDTSALSTPGLLRTHHEELGISPRIIKEYEEFIDLAEIIDGALYVDCETAHDYTIPAVKLQTLFNPSHPSIDKATNYKRLVKQIIHSSNIEELFDSDFLYSAIIQYEEKLFYQQYKAYKKTTVLNGNVAFSDFSKTYEYSGFGRFIPYLLFGESEFALHIMPSTGKGYCSVSCGVNPWKKTKQAEEKHLGNFFAKNFYGGGHAFVAGGKVHESEFDRIEKLLKYLNE